MPARLRSTNLVALIGVAAIVLTGCGATVERGADTFQREHGVEARGAAQALHGVSAAVAVLGTTPTRAQLETVALEVHRAHRKLLAADDWTPLEDGEEEGVSQAEREIHEGAAALLKAMTDLRLYTQSNSPAALKAYRQDLAGGREYWNQGIRQLWYIAKLSGPPTI